jgi:nucleotide-binding universal stress UspA family protein
MHLLLYSQESLISDEVRVYAQYVRDLVSGYLSYCQTGRGGSVSLDTQSEEAGKGYDLLIFEGSNPSVVSVSVSMGLDPGMELDPSVERLLPASMGDQGPGWAFTSLLMVRQPRWPFKKLLLVIRGEEADDAAADWIVRLAQPSGAAVTVLAIVPPVPAMYDQRPSMPLGLATMLAADTALGRRMRQMAYRLVDGEIEGLLRLRQGPPDWQIRREVAEGDYDLIVMAAEPHSRLLRRLLGELVGSLLQWVDRPVLIARK